MIARTLALALALFAAAATVSASFLRSVPYENTPLSAIAADGWTLCFTENYAFPFQDAGGLAALTAQCQGDNIMIGCGLNSTVESTGNIQLLAYTARSIVVTVNPGPGVSSGPATNDGALSWYNVNQWSFGFFPTADGVFLTECDIDSGPDRLCWHTINEAGGYRCGDISGLNQNAQYMRYAWVKGASTCNCDSFEVGDCAPDADVTWQASSNGKCVCSQASTPGSGKPCGVASGVPCTQSVEAPAKYFNTQSARHSKAVSQSTPGCSTAPVPGQIPC